MTIRLYPQPMNLSRVVVPLVAVAAVLVPSAAEAARGDVVTDAEIAQLQPGQARWEVAQITGLSGKRLWEHGEREQRGYVATHGRDLHMNFNYDPETSRWRLVNAFFFTSHGAGPSVVGR